MCKINWKEIQRLYILNITNNKTIVIAIQHAIHRLFILAQTHICKLYIKKISCLFSFAIYAWLTFYSHLKKIEKFIIFLSNWIQSFNDGQGGEGVDPWIFWWGFIDCYVKLGCILAGRGLLMVPFKNKFMAGKASGEGLKNTD